MHVLRIAFIVIGLAALAVPALAVGPHPLARVCLNTTVGHVDATAQAADSIPRDVIFGATTSLGAGTTAGYFGDSQPFNKLSVDVGQEGMGGATTWRYTTTNGFRQLTVTGDFSAEGWTTLEFAAPSDWAPVEVFHDTCTGAYYFLKAHTEMLYTVPPILDQVVVEA